MRTLLFLIEKEFRQIFRNPVLVRMIVVLPILQLVILANAVTFEVKNARMYVIDEAGSALSREIVHTLVATGRFAVVGRGWSPEEADRMLRQREADLVLHLPATLDGSLSPGAIPQIHLRIDAEDGMKAGILQGYVSRALAPLQGAPQPVLDLLPTYAYNPGLRYYDYMIPGILVVLITLVGAFLTALNIAREKELGTLDQLNVTPLTRGTFIAGKLIPFWILAQLELGLGLVIAKLVFDIAIVGSIPLIFLFSGLYLISMLGLGLGVSALSDTQQQAMFVAYFVFVVFMLLSGLFTPIEAMPDWAQATKWINPLAWFIAAMRAMLVKGATFADLSLTFFVLVMQGAAFLGLATWAYRKTSA